MIRCLFGRRGWLGVLFGLFAMELSAQVERPIVLESVKFSTARAPGIREPFYEVAIELRGERLLTDGEPVSLHRNVGVFLDLAFAVEREARREYYRSRALLVGLGAGEKRTVYFYLPPEIVERDRLLSDPLGWRVSLTVDGRALEHGDGSYSRTLEQPEAARSFLARIERDAPRNDGLLLPIYLTPFYGVRSSRLEASPSFVRDLPRLSIAPPVRPPPRP